MADIQIRRRRPEEEVRDTPVQPTGGTPEAIALVTPYWCTGIQCDDDPRFEYVLLIKRCSDPMLWYSGLVGKKVSLTRRNGVNQREGDSDTFAPWFYSRDLGGYTNLVRAEDAKLCRRLRKTHL